LGIYDGKIYLLLGISREESSALESIAFSKATMKESGELVVFQFPIREEKSAGRRLGNETVESDGRREAFEEVNDEVNVFADGKEMKVIRAGIILVGHRGVADELKLVQLEGRERKSSKMVGMAEAVGAELTRQAEDEVGADMDTARSKAANGITSFFPRVAAVDAVQCNVGGTLNADLDKEEIPAGNIGKVIDDVFAETVGTRTHHKPHHLRMRQSRLVLPAKDIYGSIGVGVVLEIDEVPHGGVFTGEATDTLFDGNGRRGKGVVAAVSTTADSFRPVSVGTAEAGINGNLLHLPVGKVLPQKVGKRTVPHRTLRSRRMNSSASGRRRQRGGNRRMV
jgi:hypothetical protein